MKRILIVGVGGIGSFLVPMIDRMNGQDEIEIAIDILDPDVVEEKNLIVQNYSFDDLYEPKVNALKKKCSLVENAIVSKVEKAKLNKYDLILSCVDNMPTRRFLYSTGKTVIDARAEGRRAMVYVPIGDSSDEILLSDDTKSGSCIKERYEGGHMIAAALAYQVFLNWVRDEDIKGKKVILSL